MVLAKSAACLGIILENENAFLGLAVLFRPALLRPNASALGRAPAARLNFMVPWFSFPWFSCFCSGATARYFRERRPRRGDRLQLQVCSDLKALREQALAPCEYCALLRINDLWSSSL